MLRTQIVLPKTIPGRFWFYPNVKTPLHCTRLYLVPSFCKTKVRNLIVIFLSLFRYDSIKTEPFKIPEDDGNDLMHTFFNPDREGWLWKQGGRYKSWKRRWFILNDNCLYYFEFTTDKEPRGIIPLENIRVREVTDRSKQHCFELFSANNEVIKACKTDSEGKVVEGKFLVYLMQYWLARNSLMV